MGDLEWYYRIPELVLLTSYMAEHGRDAKEVADAVEKPWNYEEEYAAARKELDVGLRERPLTDSQAKRLEIIDDL